MNQITAPSRYVAPSLDAAVRFDQRDAMQTRQDEARRAGFEAGYEAGMALADAEVEAMVDHHRRARDRFLRGAFALETGFDELQAKDRVTLEAIEQDVLELAFAIATEVIGRELTVTTEPVRDAIARAIRLTPDRGVPVAIVHPDDARAAREMLSNDSRWQGTVDVVGDVRIEPGGCVLEVGECRIDAQIGPAIERMRAALAD